MKICKRNNPVGWKRINAVETNVMVPKLRGGANLPKYFDTHSQKIRDILTVLRSLDMFTGLDGHPKCELKSKSELCKFCLLRSMVVKSRSMGRGPKKITPIEINAFDQEILENMDLVQSILRILEDELHLCRKILNHSECSDCVPEQEGEESHSFLHLKHPSIEGHDWKDIMWLLQEIESDYSRDHEQHAKLKQDEAEVMFVTFDYGVSVNLHENLTYKSKTWRVKSVKSKTQSLFALVNQFFEAKVEGCVLFDEATVNEVTFLAFEVVTKTSVSNTDTDNHAYKNAETKKLCGML